MYKEYRDVTLTGAVSQMYMELAGRHSARAEAIQVIRTAVLKDSEVKRAQTQQFTNKNIKFPQLHTLKRAPNNGFKSLYKAVRPTLI
jgi:large subunit ribosomal protein L18Ae